MTDQEWFRHWEASAVADNDAQRLRLLDVVYEADQYRETNPDLTLTLIQEGRRLAERLGEPWWVLFFDDRQAGTLMKYKGDVRAGMELAVRNALEVRKPFYDQYPWRFRIFDHLVVGYLNTDPVGFADEIRESLAYLARDVPDRGSPRYLVLARHRWLASELGQHEEAERLARQSLAMVASDSDQRTARSHAVFCYSHLCEIAGRRRDWSALENWVEQGECVNQHVGHLLEGAEFTTWKALLARVRGDDDDGHRFYQQATRRIAQLRMPPDHVYYDALCSYHLERDELELALRARHQELSQLVDCGRWFSEIRCRLEQCRLLLRLDRSCAQAVREARAVACKLRRPESILGQLDRLERGEFA